MRRVVYLSLVLALLACMGCASAVKAQDEAKLMAGVGAGQSDFNPKNPDLFTGTVDDTDLSIHALGRVQWSLGTPGRLLPNSRGDLPTTPNGPFAEVGYADLGTVEFDGSFDFMGFEGSDKGTVDTTAWHMALGYSYPVSQRVGVFGRIGYAWWDVEESEVFEGVPESAEASGNDLLFGAGIEVGLTPDWMLEFQWSQYKDVGEVGKTGQGDLDSITGTVLYRF